MKIKDVFAVLIILSVISISCFLCTCVKVTYTVTKVNTLEEVICKYSDVYGVGTPLIKAIIQNESGFKSGRIRCDRKALEHQSWASNVIRKYDLDRDDDIIFSSIGLGQVLTLRAILEGMDKRNPLALLIPETNIKYTTKILRGCWETYQNTFDTIAAYNYGSVRTFYSYKSKCWKYWNYQYVSDCINSYRKFGGTE